MSIERARTLRKAMPPAEARMWNALRELKPLGFHFRRQVPLGPYYADFACHHANLVIEIDGDTHWATGAQRRDEARSAFIRSEGFEIVRFTNADIMDNLDGVMTKLLSLLEGKSLPPPERGATPTLNPSPQGGGRRRVRAVVAIGHRSIDELPPPYGTGPSVVFLPSMGRDQGWGEPLAPPSNEGSK